MKRSAAMGTRATICEVRGRIYVRWWSDDPDTWRELLDDFKATFPRHGDKNFHPATKEWSIPGYKRPTLGAWLRTNFALDAIQWRADDDGEREADRERPSATAVFSLDAACAALHLRPDAPLWAAEAVYRAAQKHAHPDAGGNHAAAVAANRAIEEIRHHAAKSGAA